MAKPIKRNHKVEGIDTSTPEKALETVFDLKDKAKLVIQLYPKSLPRAGILKNIIPELLNAIEVVQKSRAPQ